MGRRPRPGRPWDAATRLRFERGARAAYPSLRGGPARRAAERTVRYTATVSVPTYEPREVTILLRPDEREPRVLVDGPSTSPHRYDDGSLCMWHPADPAAHRWQVEDGLLDLLDATVDHLFREAWWREHGEWLGPEAPHAPAPGRQTP